MGNAERLHRAAAGTAWQGPGIPTLQTLIASQLTRTVKLLLHPSSGSLRHQTAATLANIWRFHLWRPSAERVTCPCCGWRGPAFLALGNWRSTAFQSRCPQCDSRSRHRGLTNVLAEVKRVIPDGPILLFAPEAPVLNRLEKLMARTVITTDYHASNVDLPGEDIQKLTLKDDNFALILCNHVLEHVPDDEQALKECARILKPGGVAVFTVPGDFRKDSTWYFDRPDGNGHYRHYGMDIIEKMRLAFRHVKAVDMSEASEPQWRVRKGDYAFICSK